MTTPRISVLMPVRNGEAWLAEAITSVLAQGMADFELLVIDDGSTDRTHAIISAHRSRDARIRPHAQASLGLVAALNHGLAHAKGEFIARLDADDLARPERLAVQTAAMQANAELMLLGSWADVVDDEGRVTGQLTPEIAPEELRGILARTNPFIHSSVMFRAAAARNLGGYRAAFEAAEDYDLWLRLAEQGDVAILPQRLVAYREHGGNVTARKAARQLFSTRLAVRAAQARRAGGLDPAAALTLPPHWHDPATPDLANDLNVLRLLELADPDVAAFAALSAFALDAALAADLNHRERKLAQAALFNLLARADRPAGMGAPKLISEIIRLHPPRAMKLLARHLTSR